MRHPLRSPEAALAPIDYARLVDYHVHHDRCGHAVERMEAYVQAALELGLGEMGLSDHLYVYWLPRERRDPEIGMPEELYPEYVAEAQHLIRAYDGRVRLRLSSETDYIRGAERELGRILERYDFDYVLGSVHFIGDWNFDNENFVAEFDRRDVNEVYATYYDLVGAAAESGLFDVITHLDLPKKFGHRPTVDMTATHQRVVERLAKAGVAIEVNSSGLRKPVGEIYPALDLLTLCR